MQGFSANTGPGFQRLEGTTRIAGQSSFVPVQAVEYQNDTDVYVDWKRGTFQVLKLLVPVTNIYLANPIHGQTCSILLVQDSVAGRLVEWKAVQKTGQLKDTKLYPLIKWMNHGRQPILSKVADAGDMISLKYTTYPIECYWGMYTLWME